MSFNLGNMCPCQTPLHRTSRKKKGEGSRAKGNAKDLDAIMGATKLDRGD